MIQSTLSLDKQTETDRQTDKQTNRQTDRQTDRQTRKGLGGLKQLDPPPAVAGEIG